VDIDENETSVELFEKVTKVGTKTLCETLLDIENGTFVRTKQDETAVSFAPPLTKEMAKLKFGETAEHLHNLVRGFNPWPMAYFEFQDNKVKVTKSQVVMQSGEVGTVLSLTPLVIACGENALSLCEVVPSGKGAMSGSAWALGRRFVIGEKIV
ncbi:MAG: methionyl-tRNA formyltransferase, partial [Oscillospiraceae bacterium]